MTVPARPPLPIDDVLERIAARLASSPNLVVEAPPGAGKTTRVPPRLLDLVTGGREVWVLEPRRLAARAAARRVASELGEPVGRTVGHTVRFDDVTGPETRLRFVTEGVMTRRFLADPSIERIGALILDEFHERHIHADVAIALARRLQRSARPDLRIVAMSATLDATPVAEFLGNADVVRSPGRRFDVDVSYDARPDGRPLAERVAAAVGRLVADGLDGDVLVFLPGAAEIRRAATACAAIAVRAGLELVPLHGDLPSGEQDRAIAPSATRRVILSTNVAESSITIDGVVAVVDSGLARVPGFSPWSGLPTLETSRISRASADQRAGRAGRLRPGRCIRLYTAQDLAARPEHTTAEIHRSDLAETALTLHAAGAADLEAFPWFERPASGHLAAADELLERLGALEHGGRVTAAGRRMLALPVHPRLARLVIEAAHRGAASSGCLTAAVLSERDPRARPSFDGGRPPGPAADGPSDTLAIIDRLADPAGAIDRATATAIRRAAGQLERALARQPDGAGTVRDLSGDVDTALGLATLAAFPDRVAKVTAAGSTARDARVTLALAMGGAATLDPSSVVWSATLLVALDAEVRRAADGSWSSRGGGAPLVRTACRIEPDWLIELFADRLADERETIWSAEGERAVDVRRLVYDRLIIDTSARPAEPSEATAALVGAAAVADPAIVEAPAVVRLLARIRFAAGAVPESGLSPLSAEDFAASIVDAAEGLVTLAELHRRMPDAVTRAVARRAGHDAARRLAVIAPERVRLACGREVRIEYADSAPPWIASRLQDFFGMRAAPTIANGRIPLVVHLLAPSQRPVQVTSDLTGFWENHYPTLRRELARRYPKHAWPEDPLERGKTGGSGPSRTRRPRT